MAFDRQQIRLSALGTLGTFAAPTEIFSWSLHISGAADFDALVALAAADAAAVTEAVRSFHTAVNSFISPDADLRSVKLAALDTAGHYLGDAVNTEVTLSGSGSGAGPRYPNQVALAISLRTVVNLGRATKGRFYLPLPTALLDVDGFIDDSGNVASIRTSVVDMLNAINDEFDTGPEPSRVALMSDIGAGLTRAVTQVRVGNVMDTIRARRNALDETYLSQNLA